MPEQIASDEIRAEISVENGARISSLRDLVTGREWLAQDPARGGHVPDPGESAIYGAADAVGWDECFPTVSPWDATDTAWGQPLRDHGMFWGRPAELVESTPTRITTRYAGPLFAFRRAVSVAGRELRADYRLENRGADPLPWLWAAHAMLAVTPADRILLPGVSRVEATHVAREGQAAAPGTLGWPGPNTDWPAPFDRVESAQAQAAAKLYVDDLPGGPGFVGNDTDGWLRIAWSPWITALGLWLNYGGWPGPGGTHHIGLEPTNAPVDHLGQAIARGTAPLPPGASARWSVTYTLRASPP